MKYFIAHYVQRKKRYLKLTMDVFLNDYLLQIKVKIAKTIEDVEA